MEKSGKILTIAAGFALLLIVLVAVALAYAGRDVTLLQDRVLHLTVNGYTMEVPLSEDGAIYDVPSLHTGNDNEFVLLNDAGASIKVDGATLKTNKTTKVNVERLSTNEILEVTAASGKDTRTVYFRTRSSLLPEMINTGHGEGDGQYYVTVADKPVIYRIDGKGELNWYVALSEEQAQGKIFTDFQKYTLDDETVRYGYQAVDPDAQTYGLTDCYPGTRMLYDEKYKELKRDGARLSLLDQNDTELDPDVMGDPVDGHDFILLGDNHWITISYQLVNVTNIPASLNPPADGTKVIAAVIQEVEDGKPVFTWTSTDYPQLYSLSTKGNNWTASRTQPQDYLHINGIALDPSDQNLIVSFANAPAIVKIDRESGEILWILSGNGDEFGLTEDQKAACIDSLDVDAQGVITVMDGSRIISYTLDETAKKAKTVEVYTMEGYKANGGSAERVGDGTYLISFGKTDGTQPAVTEMNFKDKIKNFEMVLPDGEAISCIHKSE